MNKTIAIVLILIIIGSTYFREVFQWVWVGIGLLFFAFLIWYHMSEKIEERKQNKRRSKEG